MVWCSKRLLFTRGLVWSVDEVEKGVLISLFCLFVSFIRQRCVRHNSSSFCKYIRMMIYLLALTKVFLLFLAFLLFYVVFILFRLLIHPLFYLRFFEHNLEKKQKRNKIQT